MTNRLRRVLVTAVALVSLAGVSPAAQTVPTTSKPTPSPSVTPQIEQRFERVEAPPRTPGRVRVAGTVVADEVPQEFFIRQRPVLRIGQPYTLKVGETAWDVRAVMADVTIDGHVEGDVVAVLGDVKLGASAVVDGALVVIGGGVTAAAGARVGSDLVLVGGSLDAPADFSPQGEHIVVGTAALGQAIRAFVPWITRGLLWGRIIVPDLGWVWVIVGIVFLLGLILNLLFIQPVAACADTLARRPLSSFLMGLVTLMLLPVLVVVLTATVVGIVVVPFAVAAFVVAAMVGRISVARALGRAIVGESDASSRFQASRSFAVGSAVIVIALMVPIVGLMAWLFIGSFGLGAATMTFFGSLRRERPPAAPRPAGPAPEPPPAREAPAAPPLMTYAAADPAPPSRPAGGAAVAGGDLTLFPRATFFDRLAAVALDFVLVGIATAFLDFDRYNRGPGPFFLLLFAYHVAFWAWKGTTLGGIICSLRVVRATNVPMRFADALVRGLTSIFSAIALGIGFFWMLNDPERQTWHDKIAGTVVVKLPRDLVLE